MKSVINAVSIDSFISTAWIICSCIHFFHLYMKSLCYNRINSTFDIFFFQHFLPLVFFLSAKFMHTSVSFEKNMADSCCIFIFRSFKWKNNKSFQLLESVTPRLPPSRLYQSWLECKILFALKMLDAFLCFSK